MHAVVTLTVKGDGKQRLEELIAHAIEKLAKNADVKEAFRDHPVLSTTSTEELLGKVSRKRAARVIESGLMADNDGRELMGDAIFGRGRELETTIPLAMLLSELGLMPPTLSRELPKVQVLFENEDFLAVYKPHNLPSAPLRSEEEDSVVHRAMAHYPKLPILRGNPLEPGLVHRLDTGTSGVLLFVKNLGAFDRTQKIWNSGQVKKEYRAIARLGPGAPPLAARKQDLLLGHDLKSKRKMRVIRGPQDAKLIRGDAQKAVSEILRLSPANGGRDVDVTIRIETGVHHQIRATLAYLNAPILGDSVYGGATGDRLWLHARKLVLPSTLSNAPGKSFEIVAPLPVEWPTG